MYLAVVDLVAAVGLWMRVAWGKVLWICAAVSEIALHTVFIRPFGSDLPGSSFSPADPRDFRCADLSWPGRQHDSLTAGKRRQIHSNLTNPVSPR